MVVYVTSVEGIGTQYPTIAEFSLAQKCGTGVSMQSFDQTFCNKHSTFLLYSYVESITQQLRKSVPPFPSTSHCNFYSAHLCDCTQQTIIIRLIHLLLEN